MRQLLLPFDQKPDYCANNFWSNTGNALAQKWLANPSGWTNGRLVLWGEAGCGKTHLLHIWAAANQAKILLGPYLRGILEAPLCPLAIDDADLPADEIALLHLLNAAAEAGYPVLMTARLPPARQTLQLPDLASRLRASLATEIRAPEDAELAIFLAHLAASRQLVLDIHVQNLLLSHLPRTPAALAEAVVRLDRAALANGGKITRTLALNLIYDLSVID
ncbi:MAG: chromosomal replication initiator DnaA [Acidocella sp.]|nr:chromosomal replication initiator DnaA [Acidocella sp.]